MATATVGQLSKAEKLARIHNHAVNNHLQTQLKNIDKVKMGNAQTLDFEKKRFLDSLSVSHENLIGSTSRRSSFSSVIYKTGHLSPAPSPLLRRKGSIPARKYSDATPVPRTSRAQSLVPVLPYLDTSSPMPLLVSSQPASPYGSNENLPIYRTSSFKKPQQTSKTWQQQRRLSHHSIREHYSVSSSMRVGSPRLTVKHEIPRKSSY